MATPSTPISAENPTEATPAEPKRTIDDMLEQPGFGAWLGKVESVKGLPLNEANRDRVEKLFKGWEASKETAEKYAQIYSEKLSSEGFGHALTAEDTENIAGLLGKEAMNPILMELRKKNLEQFEALPNEIAAKEAELVALAAQAEGVDTEIAELKARIVEAQKTKDESEKNIKPVSEEVKLSTLEYLSYRMKVLRGRANFDQQLDNLKGKGDPKSLAEKEKLTRLRDHDRSSSNEIWKADVAHLDAAIAELTKEVQTREEAKARLTALPGEIKGLKRETALIKQRVFTSVPIHADIHTRVQHEIVDKLTEAGSSNYLWKLEDAVQETRRLEELAKREGSGSDYLTGLGDILTDYKVAVNEKIEALVTKDLADTIKGIPDSAVLSDFEACLQEFTEKATTGLGFKNPAESKVAVIQMLIDQQKNGTTGSKGVFLNRIIAKLHAKR